MADCSLASPHQPTPGRAGGDIALLNQPTGQGGLGPLAALAQRLIADSPAAGQLPQPDLLDAGRRDQLGVHRRHHPAGHRLMQDQLAVDEGQRLQGRPQDLDDLLGPRRGSEAAGLDDALEEGLGAGVGRLGEDLLGRALLADDPLVEEADPAGRLPGDRHPLLLAPERLSGYCLRFSYRPTRLSSASARSSACLRFRPSTWRGPG
jgi:hypothetical protein